MRTHMHARVHVLLLCTLRATIGIRPIINRQEDDGAIVWTAHSRPLMLNCTHPTEPIMWLLPNNTEFRGYSNPRNDGRLQKWQSTRQPDGTYLAMLQLNDPNPLDTGPYTCATDPTGISTQFSADQMLHNELPRSKHVQSLTEETVYVFVQDPYNNTLIIMHPKADSYLKIVNIRQASNIGCRTTTPYVNMFLTIKSFALPSSSYSFDARTGITLHADALKLSETLVPAACVATTNERSPARTQLGDRQQMNLLTVETRPIVMRIDPSDEAMHAYKGGEFTLDCIAEHQQSMMCKWSYPAQAYENRDVQSVCYDSLATSTDQRFTQKRIRTIPLPRNPHSNTIGYRLDVKNVTLDVDNGTYICECCVDTFTDGKRGVANTKFIEWELVNISLTKGQISSQMPLGPLPMYVIAGKNAVIVANFTAWPASYSRKWIKEKLVLCDGKVQTAITENLPRISLTQLHGVAPDFYEEHLTISTAEISDSANYSLEVETGCDGRSKCRAYAVANISLTVFTEKPELYIDIYTEEDFRNDAFDKPVNPNYLVLYKRYVVTTRSFGRLPPNGEYPEMLLQKCEKPQNGDCLSTWYTLNKASDALWDYEVGEWKLLAYHFNATHATFYRVVMKHPNLATKEIAASVVPFDDPEHREFIINITHTQKWDAVDEPNGKIFQGDELRIDCVTAKSVPYSRWLMRYDATGEPIVIGTSNNTQISNRHEVVYDTSNEFVNSLAILWKKVHGIDNATYFCQVVSASNNLLEDNYTLSVIATRRPIFEPTTDWVNNGTMTVKYAKSVTLACPYGGVPPPRLEWRKDGKVYSGRSSGTVGTVKYNAESNELKIYKAIEEDAGEYECRISNREGSKSKFTRLDVIGGPEKPFLSQGAIIGLVLSLCVAALVVIFLTALLVRQCHIDRKRTKLLTEIYNKLMHPTEDKIDNKLPLNKQTERLAYNPQYEISREALKVYEKELGRGQFGIVFLGCYSRDINMNKRDNFNRAFEHAGSQSSLQPVDVAVKVPLNGRIPQHQKALLDEAKLMIHIGSHPNVLSLIGAVTKLIVKGELYVVVELCELGDMRTFLRNARKMFIDEILPPEDAKALRRDRDSSQHGDYILPNSQNNDTDEVTYYQVALRALQTKHHLIESDPTWAQQTEQSKRNDLPMVFTRDLLSFAYQAANGMCYLSKKNIIHRDLAARNLLLTSDRIVKIADFGLAKEFDIDPTYTVDVNKRDSMPLPLKWMAPEAICEKKFSIHSDVWSFGVMCWEIFELGEAPYAGYGLDIPAFVDYIKRGDRLPKPNWYTLYNCWLADPESRATFDQCRTSFRRELRRCSPELFAKVVDVATPQSSDEEVNSNDNDYYNAAEGSTISLSSNQPHSVQPMNT